jgi:hypothetical protein
MKTTTQQLMTFGIAAVLLFMVIMVIYSLTHPYQGRIVGTDMNDILSTKDGLYLCNKDKCAKFNDLIQSVPTIDREDVLKQINK